MLHFQSVQVLESRDYPVAQGFTVFYILLA